MNIRGSTGYGYEFAAEVFGNFEEVLEDIYDGIEFFDAEGLIDKNNLCIYGGSYGGYAATMAPINRPDLFKCAASDAGLYDMEAQYKRGDVRRSRGGKVFLDRAFKGKDGKLDASQSPINRVSEMKVPFFLLHGKKDIRTPYKDAELFMEEMDRNNISYEKMIITKEEHGFSNEENREASMERLLKFFNKYL
jgi:acylaminoacyl-peptidase